MKALLLPTILGTTLLATGCANHEHEHDESERAGHSRGQHQEMMNDHHKDMMDGGQSGSHHMDGAGHGEMGHHGSGHDGMGHGDSLAGRPGKESEVDRVVNVEANDSMRFIHDPIKVTTGETIKFEIINKGAIPHEFSIGTKDEHMAHGKMMMDNPDMHHGPGGASITIAPGKTESLIWYFEEAWEVQAACNIPGHYQAGMHSPVLFEGN